MTVRSPVLAPEDVDRRLTNDFLREQAGKYLEVEERFHQIREQKVKFRALADQIRSAAKVANATAPEHVVAKMIAYEVEALHKAAQKGNVDALRVLLSSASPETRAWINQRSFKNPDCSRSLEQRFGADGTPIRERRLLLVPENMIEVCLPGKEAFLDPQNAQIAIETVLTLTTLGESLVNAQYRYSKDASGRSVRRLSKTFKRDVYVPYLHPHRARNTQARDLVAYIRKAFLSIYDFEPARTSNGKFPSGFSQFLQSILHQIGAGSVSSIEIINHFDATRPSTIAKRESRRATNKDKAE